MDISVVTKKLRVSKQDLVRAQVLMEVVFVKRKHLSEVDIDILTLLGVSGPMDLSRFCEYASDIVYKTTEKPLARVQNIRNRLSVLEKQGFVVKKINAKKPKMLSLATSLVNSPNVMIEYKILNLGAN